MRLAGPDVQSTDSIVFVVDDDRSVRDALTSSDRSGHDGDSDVDLLTAFRTPPVRHYPNRAAYPERLPRTLDAGKRDVDAATEYGMDFRFVCRGAVHVCGVDVSWLRDHLSATPALYTGTQAKPIFIDIPHSGACRRNRSELDVAGYAYC